MTMSTSTSNILIRLTFRIKKKNKFIVSFPVINCIEYEDQ